MMLSVLAPRVTSTSCSKQANVRLADIDGDGRGDYCILDDGGNVHCWRNGWVDDVPEYWQPLCMRFKAKGMGNINGVRFEDVNGDVSPSPILLHDESDTNGAKRAVMNGGGCARTA